MKLEFGCGESQPKPGFVGVDIRPAPHVNFVCNAWEISDKVSPGSVSEIFSRHFFEHLTFLQAAKTLDVWLEVLAPGGSMQMIVPNMTYHISQWMDPMRAEKLVPGKSGLTLEQHAVRGFWGHQREGFEKVWDIHKSGYDWPLLKCALAEHGFVNVRQLDDMPKNLNVVAQKPM